MTTYFWSRAKTGLSQASGPGTFASAFLRQFVPGDDVTVRRVIIDWGVDLLSGDRTGTINSGAAGTLGLSCFTSGDSTPAPPGVGPAADPTADWLWWEGVWYTNPYDTPVDSGATSGVFSANGRIDRKVNTTMDNEAYSPWYLTFELDDSGNKWETWDLIVWWQILYAHIG